MKRLARDVAPLLRRLSALSPPPPDAQPSEALETWNAEAALRQSLGDTSPTNFATVWGAFCEFALRPVAGLDPEADQDLLLFECAVEPSRLIVDLIRQFTDADEDAEMEQLRCSVSMTLADDGPIRGITRPSLWGRGGSAAGAWIEAVEATPAFVAARSTDAATVEVSQSPV
jgi:hypothetical protein